MKIEITGKNIEVTEGIRVAVEESITEVEKYFVDKDINAKVVVRTYPVGQKIEVTLGVAGGQTIRQEVQHEDLYAAIDIVGKKLEKQIRRMKERVTTTTRRKESVVGLFSDFETEKENLQRVTRRKELSNKPMTEEEAILQFELSGHDFYVFDDFEVDVVKILYKRKDGEYGVIELLD